MVEQTDRRATQPPQEVYVAEHLKCRGDRDTAYWHRFKNVTPGGVRRGQWILVVHPARLFHDETMYLSGSKKKKEKKKKDALFLQTINDILRITGVTGSFSDAVHLRAKLFPLVH